MRYFLAILFILVSGQIATGQEIREARVSYITSQHVYVKFSSMENISEGDTLYIKQGDKEVAALQVKNISSISCVCIPLVKDAFKVSGKVYANLEIRSVSEPVDVPYSVETEQSIAVPETVSQADTAKREQYKQVISGRISLSSYSDFYGDEHDRNQRMRYTFSFRGDHLGNSKISFESYLSFAHNNTNWDEIKDNIFNGLKIYNLSVKYAFDESSYLSFGRKINPKLSSVGAIDGLQFEKKFKTFSVGAVAGSRPDYEDYSINPKLMQYGIYLGHELESNRGSMQNTFAFMEQMNHSETDRRFLYFQHSNMLVKNLFFFASGEVDLYKKIDDTPETVFDLSNTYVSLRYRIIRPLTIGLSYSARKNIIYYETYKDFVERLLESEILQGWRFRMNYRPIKYMYLGINAGYRFRKDDPRPTKNLNGYLTYSQVPGIGASVTLSSTWLETNYLNGIVYGLGISQNLVSDKLSAGLKYRYVDYLYRNSEMDLIQHVGEANLSWMIYRKLSLSIFYEGTFETELNYNRVYLNITQRF